MKTNSTLLMLMILLTSVTTFAQQTKIGFTAGAAFSKLKAKADNVSFSYDFKLGITAGLFVDVPLSSNFSFQPALNLVQKGGSLKLESLSDKMTLNYLEVPLNFIYNTAATHGFFIGAGPAMAFGLSGKDKTTDGTESENDKIKFGSGEDEVKRFEFSANVISGYRFNQGFMFSANYDFGFTNLANADSEDGTMKSSYFSVKIGWVLPGKKK
jgi:hypothetical protein